MKNIFYIALLIGIFSVVAVLISKQTPTVTETEPVLFSATDGTYCYARAQEATPTEPYSVEEQISVTLVGSSVTGEKSGTQAGPDMTNGYQGTLAGIIHENTLELVYAYTIEGSSNKELEVYEIAENTLTKHRFPLVEVDGVLVPERTTEPVLIGYTQIACQE